MEMIHILGIVGIVAFATIGMLVEFDIIDADIF
jgi:uncharacterized membrane protein YeiH